jgi:DNA (cytosine-5)-methyltransferase 1
MSYENIKELVSDVDYSELEGLVAKNILRTYEDGSFEFVNRRLSGGIDGTYRIFLPTARFFGTLTARGMKDEVAEVSVTGRTEEEYKQNFVKDVLQPRRHRKITVREAARLQAFPDTFRLHSNAEVSMRLLGNSVAVPVVHVVARSLVHTGALARDTQLSLAI